MSVAGPLVGGFLLVDPRLRFGDVILQNPIPFPPPRFAAGVQRTGAGAWRGARAPARASQAQTAVFNSQLHSSWFAR